MQKLHDTASLYGVRSVTRHMGSHSVTFYQTQVNAPRLHPSQTGGTRFTDHLRVRVE